jgi:hypothetical protein
MIHVEMVRIPFQVSISTKYYVVRKFTSFGHCCRNHVVWSSIWSMASRKKIYIGQNSGWRITSFERLRCSDTFVGITLFEVQCFEKLHRSLSSLERLHRSKVCIVRTDWSEFRWLNNQVKMVKHSIRSLFVGITFFEVLSWNGRTRRSKFNVWKNYVVRKITSFKRLRRSKDRINGKIASFELTGQNYVGRITKSKDLNISFEVLSSESQYLNMLDQTQPTQTFEPTYMLAIRHTHSTRHNQFLVRIIRPTRLNPHTRLEPTHMHNLFTQSKLTHKLSLLLTHAPTGINWSQE